MSAVTPLQVEPEEPLESLRSDFADALAQIYGLRREPGETDEALRSRVDLFIEARRAPTEGSENPTWRQIVESLREVTRRYNARFLALKNGCGMNAVMTNLRKEAFGQACRLVASGRAPRDSLEPLADVILEWISCAGDRSWAMNRAIEISGCGVTQSKLEATAQRALRWLEVEK